MSAATLIRKGMNFEAEYRAHFACVWRNLRRLGVSEKDVSDLTQEVFLIACQNFGRFEARSTVKTWLIGIAYGVAANHRRSATVRCEVLGTDIVDAMPGRVDAQRQLEQRDELRRLEEILSQLSLEQRAVFTMFEMEGLTGEEIADVLRIPLGTVRSRIRLAREAFTQALAARPSAPGGEP